jgi:hypothetical protein
MNTLRLILCACALLIIIGLTGCAYGGSGTPAGPEVVIDFYVRMAAAVNESFYYFIPIDTDGDFGADGPVPVAAGPNWENGWGTGSFTYYVQYHQHEYFVYRTVLLARVVTPGGGIISATGNPTNNTVGVSTLTVQSLSLGTIGVTGAGMIASAANTGFQAAGTLAVNTDALGNIVAGSVVFTAAPSGGRALTPAEQAVITGLNAGGVPLQTNSLVGLGITLTLNPVIAGTQTLTIAPTTATVQNAFTPAVNGEEVDTTGTLQANTSNTGAGSPIPGATINTGDLVAGGSASVRLDLTAAGSPVGPPYDSTLPNGSAVLRCTIDLATLGTNIPDLSVNFITTDALVFDQNITDPNLHTYDGLGWLGNRYVTFRTNQFQTIDNNSGLFEQEGAGDQTLAGLATPAEQSQVDIIDWSVTIRRLQ